MIDQRHPLYLLALAQLSLPRAPAKDDALVELSVARREAGEDRPSRPPEPALAV